MTEKIITQNNFQYRITVKKLSDNSYEGKIFRSETEIVKMNLSESDSSDLEKTRNEEPECLILRLLESYAKSGLVIGTSN
ncbi:MAG TPA: hypothetical protein VGO57_17470 [Verrucomicrobiae bacterium]|jgi:hypothetical protein